MEKNGKNGKKWKKWGKNGEKKIGVPDLKSCGQPCASDLDLKL